MNKLVSLMVAIVLLTSCGLLNKKDKYVSYRSFINKADYPETYDVYISKALMRIANPKNTSIEIDTYTQRLKLKVLGRVALDTPATTGSAHKKDINDGLFASKETPSGEFEITEKIESKRSTLYGDIIINNRVVYTGERLKFTAPYDRYEGVKMPYWMRFNKSIGMHQSEAVSRYPGSNGCVRLPMDSVKKVYAVVKVGTKVKVMSSR